MYSLRSFLPWGSVGFFGGGGGGIVTGVCRLFVFSETRVREAISRLFEDDDGGFDAKTCSFPIQTVSFDSTTDLAISNYISSHEIQQRDMCVYIKMAKLPVEQACYSYATSHGNHRYIREETKNPSATLSHRSMNRICSLYRWSENNRDHNDPMRA